MQILGQYTKDDRMCDLVSCHYRVLLVMSRFGIGLGFGDKSIDEVCREAGVDTTTFLVITNMLLSEDTAIYDPEKLSLEALLVYLQKSHTYFLGFRLPGIREKLVSIVDGAGDLSTAIINYFDGYIKGVNAHMRYEDEVVFPYVRALLAGSIPDDYRIEIFQKRHDQVEVMLTEFKNILIKYYPSESTNELNGVLLDIFECERDLASHNAVEDMLFVPAVAALEKNVEA